MEEMIKTLTDQVTEHGTKLAEHDVRINTAEKNISTLSEKVEDIHKIASSVELIAHDMSYMKNDISDVLPEKREEYIGRFIREFYMLPMDITENFPVLFELIKVADDEFILFVCMHHIIGDSISAGAVYKDICSILALSFLYAFIMSSIL